MGERLDCSERVEQAARDLFENEKRETYYAIRERIARAKAKGKATPLGDSAFSDPEPDLSRDERGHYTRGTLRVDWHRCLEAFRAGYALGLHDACD